MVQPYAVGRGWGRRSSWAQPPSPPETGRPSIPGRHGTRASAEGRQAQKGPDRALALPCAARRAASQHSADHLHGTGASKPPSPATSSRWVRISVRTGPCAWPVARQGKKAPRRHLPWGVPRLCRRPLRRRRRRGGEVGGASGPAARVSPVSPEEGDAGDGSSASYQEFEVMMKSGSDWRNASRRFSRANFSNLDMPNLEIWPTSLATESEESQHQLFMFPVLKTVTASGCPKMRPKPCLPDAIADLSLSNSGEMLSVGGMFGPSSSKSASLLRRLWITNCHASSNDWNLLQHRPKLEDLTIEYCERLHVLPMAISYLSMLRMLKIDNCTDLEILPEWLGNLMSLESLEISCCPKLVSLPEGLQRLSALEVLIVSGCSSALTENCKVTGKDWFKISHIPSILIS